METFCESSISPYVYAVGRTRASLFVATQGRLPPLPDKTYILAMLLSWEGSRVASRVLYARNWNYLELALFVGEDLGCSILYILSILSNIPVFSGENP